MHNFFAKKRLTAFLFIVVLAAFSILNMIQSFEPLKKTLASADYRFSNAKGIINKVDADINEHVFEKFGFVEAYGYLQALMWKNEENNFEVVKDTEGKLHYTYFATGPTDTKQLSDRVAELGAQLDATTKLTYVMTPDKYVRGHTTFPEGIPYNYNNETADGFLNHLKQAGIDTLDLREGLLESGIPAKELFSQPIITGKSERPSGRSVSWLIIWMACITNHWTRSIILRISTTTTSFHTRISLLAHKGARRGNCMQVTMILISSIQNSKRTTRSISRQATPRQH